MFSECCISSFSVYARENVNINNRKVDYTLKKRKSVITQKTLPLENTTTAKKFRNFFK